MTWELAVEYVAAGISVIPLRLDGSKSPAVSTWAPYQQRLPTKVELQNWFGLLDQSGIGMVCGEVSGGLEVIDFDMPELFWPWATLIGADLFNLLTVVETPGGWHVIYRCNEICGNRVIARWERPTSFSQRQKGHRDGTGFQSIGKGVRIETRGEGGYIVAEGSPCETHSTGLPYVQAFGPRLPGVQRISPEQRRQLWLAAASFDCGGFVSQRVIQAKRELQRQRFGAVVSDGSEPWTWFDRYGQSWDQILRPHGWNSRDGIEWIRPGKRFGTSAVITTNDDGEQVLTVYSTNAGPLAPVGRQYQSYGKFAALVALEFGGDRKAAARYVAGIRREAA